MQTLHSVLERAPSAAPYPTCAALQLRQDGADRPKNAAVGSYCINLDATGQSARARPRQPLNKNSDTVVAESPAVFCRPRLSKSARPLSRRPARRSLVCSLSRCVRRGAADAVCA